MRIASWNVNGIRAVATKGFAESLEKIGADVIGIQEIKALKEQLGPEITDIPGYKSWFYSAERKGYSGTALYSKIEPKSVEFGFGVEEFDHEGRVIKADFGDFVLFKEVICCGDVNTAHKEIDLSNPKANSKISGFLPEERAYMDKFIERGLTDTFRMLHPDDKECYTWWSYKTAARERNVGWRIDYFFTTDGLNSRVKESNMMTDIMGSDHCPIYLDI